MTSEDTKRYDRSSIRKLLCSSAPVHKRMKLEIMDFFSGVDLYEGYGSTEAGIVTIFKPKINSQIGFHRVRIAGNRFRQTVG